MQNDTKTTVSTGLAAELNWLYRVIDARLKLYFGHECEVAAIREIAPPPVDGGSFYGYVVRYYDLSFEERLVLALALAPHLRPQLLDAFFTQNAATGQSFSEFGGVRHPESPGFLPTGETALFLLGGEDLEQRLAAMRLFDPDHFFARHEIVTLGAVKPGVPRCSGALVLGPEIFDVITTGQVRQPGFGPDFPARHVETPLEWEDLVLNATTMAQVLEIKAWIDHGDKLLYELGLDRHVKPGYRSLFCGPPGTGKTLTAMLLGKISGRPVFRIDLSLVVSKYIGETEKNLEKIFRRAEHKNWILFFDEADALFGKRTSIGDAHDRYANQEVSYLLQRVEDYAGVVILATNFKSNLDEAFTRRFQSVIHFPMPNKTERLQLWQKALSPKTVPEEKIDLAEVAEKYELSGGAIINVVRHATLMALQDGRRVIYLADLLTGIRREFQKEGKTF